MHITIHITFQSGAFAQKTSLEHRLISRWEDEFLLRQEDQAVTTLLAYDLQTRPSSIWHSTRHLTLRLWIIAHLIIFDTEICG